MWRNGYHQRKTNFNQIQLVNETVSFHFKLMPIE